MKNLKNRVRKLEKRLLSDQRAWFKFRHENVLPNDTLNYKNVKAIAFVLMSISEPTLASLKFVPQMSWIEELLESCEDKTCFDNFKKEIKAWEKLST
jgi:hypothetical protein